MGATRTGISSNWCKARPKFDGELPAPESEAGSFGSLFAGQSRKGAIKSGERI